MSLEAEIGEVPGGRPGGEVIGDTRPSVTNLRGYPVQSQHANAEFIAWCRTGVPALVEYAERLRGALTTAEAEIVDLTAGWSAGVEKLMAAEAALTTAEEAVLRERALTDDMHTDLVAAREALAGAEAERDSWERLAQKANRACIDEMKRAEAAEAALATCEEARRATFASLADEIARADRAEEALATATRDAARQVADDIETAGRQQVRWLMDHSSDAIDRARTIGAEDAYKDAIRIARAAGMETPSEHALGCRIWRRLYENGETALRFTCDCGAGGAS